MRFKEHTKIREAMRREVEKGKNDGEGVMSGMTKRERMEE